MITEGDIVLLGIMIILALFPLKTVFSGIMIIVALFPSLITFYFLISSPETFWQDIALGSGIGLVVIGAIQFFFIAGIYSLLRYGVWDWGTEKKEEKIE